MAALVPIGMLLQALITAYVAPSDRTHLALITLFGFTPQSSLLRILSTWEEKHGSDGTGTKTASDEGNDNEEEAALTLPTPQRHHVEEVKSSGSFVAAQGIARFV